MLTELLTKGVELVNFAQFAQNLFTFGLVVEKWENLHYTRWKSIGAFESEVFQPEKWKETYPFEPIRQSQADDDYWAAKIVGALTCEHIQSLVKAAIYPEPGAADYMIKTLMDRRHKILVYHLNNVSPVEAIEFSNGVLRMQDMAQVLLGLDSTKYEIRFYNDVNKEVAEQKIIRNSTEQFTIPVSDALVERAAGYLRVDVWVVRGSNKAPSPAQFHIRAGSNSSPRLVGVVH